MRLLLLSGLLFSALISPSSAQDSMLRLAPNASDNYQFGLGLTIIGNSLFVQSSDHGIEVFSNESGDWLRADTLLSGRRNLSARRSGDNLVVVDSSNVFTFANSGGKWIVTSTLTLPDLGSVGYHVLSDSLVLVGAGTSSSPWTDLYKRTGNDWSLHQTIDPFGGGQNGFRFKCTVNDRLVFGAPRDPTSDSSGGSAYVYKLQESGEYGLEQRIVPGDIESSDQFGRTIACSENGLAINSYSGGKTYLFTRADTVWQDAIRIQVPGNNSFLSVSWLGDLLMVRNENLMDPFPDQTFDAYESTVYLLEIEDSRASIRHIIRTPKPVDRSYESSDGGFGRVVAHDGDLFAIAAYFRDTQDHLSVGEVFVTRFSDLPLVSSITEDPIDAVVADVYPNPAANHVTVGLDVSARRTMTVSVFDVLGRLIKTQSRDARSAGRLEHSLDVSDLTPGLYAIAICLDGISCSSETIVVAR